MALILMSQAVAVMGLPELILVDVGSEFKDVIVKTCETPGIKCHQESKENHEAILAE